MFYINNYINQNQFNQLYNPDQFNKNIQNMEIIIYKFEPTSTKVTNLRLQKARKK